MSKDWTGNYNSIYKTLGASNHTDHKRAEHDYYATSPEAVVELLKVEEFCPNIWEPACGELHISKVLKSAGYKVFNSDIVYRGYEDKVVDFLKTNEKDLDIDIITNPPYKKAKEFVAKALATVSDGHKVAMLLKLTFLEGKKRGELFNTNPPKKVYVFRNRTKCAMNGDFDRIGSSAITYAWFVWEKGFKGKPTIDWVKR